jgi:hypothetical protein
MWPTTLGFVPLTHSPWDDSLGTSDDQMASDVIDVVMF